MMIPDTQRRLAEAINDLFSWMQENDEKPEVMESKDFAKAQAFLEEYDGLVTD